MILQALLRRMYGELQEPQSVTISTVKFVSYRFFLFHSLQLQFVCDYFSLFQPLLYFSPATWDLIIFCWLNLLNRLLSQGGADLPSIEVFIAWTVICPDQCSSLHSLLFSSPTVLPPMTISLFPALPSPSHWSSPSLPPRQRGCVAKQRKYHLLIHHNGDQTLILFVPM